MSFSSGVRCDEKSISIMELRVMFFGVSTKASSGRHQILNSRCQAEPDLRRAFAQMFDRMAILSG